MPAVLFKERFVPLRLAEIMFGYEPSISPDGSDIDHKDSGHLCARQQPQKQNHPSSW